MFNVTHLPRQRKNVDNSLVDYGIVKLWAENVRNVLKVAIERQLHDTQWYAQARTELQEIADAFAPYDVTLQDVAWIVATLSPNVSWETGQNQRSAIAFLSQWLGLPCEFSNSAYGPNIAKCVDYMLGKIDNAPSGPKVSAFYRNLLGDESVLTIDRHAMRIALFGTWRLSDETGDMAPSVREHKLITQAYTIVANEYGISLSQLQAVTWQVVNQKGS